MADKHKIEEEEHWSATSDPMAGLMMVFLLVSIAYMHAIEQDKQEIITAQKKIEREQEKIKAIVVTYQETQSALYDQLNDEFKEDLPRWQASIDRESLSVQLFEPEILFQAGSAEVTPKFKEILDDFFPRYLEVIFSDKFREAIAEVRIEGHTSSEWIQGKSTPDEAYFHNMQLSQERTRSVLMYCHEVAPDKYKNLMKQHVTANGLSSSKLIYQEDGTEDMARSRRVEFRTRTNADRRIKEILGELEND